MSKDWVSNRFDLGVLFCVILIEVLICSTAFPQEVSRDDKVNAPLRQTAEVAEQIDVQPGSSDQVIDKRLTSIMEKTGWFSGLAVQVQAGVVFLDGKTQSADYRIWAGELAGKTSDVVTVVNRIEVAQPSLWDFSPAVDELEAIWKRTVQRLPQLGLGLLILIIVFITAKLAANGTRKILSRRLNPLLRDVAARVLSIFVLLIGFYLVLRVAGLSGLAATVLGGTGLVGLVAGIAFRDILENYLASILISVRNPFMIGDLVTIADHTGIVQRVTTRGTVLINLDGNHVQIPNAMVYKSIIRNYTANPNRRGYFEVGIGYENNVSFAQEIALKVMNSHSAILGDPESLVLVDRLGSATVILMAYFWYDGSVFDGFKVRSSLIRQVKRAFEEHGISMPDEAREIIFPEGVPVRMLEKLSTEGPQMREKKAPEHVVESENLATEAEGDLTSEDEQLREQARKARIPEEGADLLEEEK